MKGRKGKGNAHFISKKTSLFICIGSVFCFIFCINIMYLYKIPAAVLKKNIHENTNEKVGKDTFSPRIPTKNKVGTNGRNVHKLVETGKKKNNKVIIHTNNNTDKYNVKQRTNDNNNNNNKTKIFSRHSAIAKELHKLEKHLHMLNNDRNRNRVHNPTSIKVNNRESEIKKLLLKNVNSIPFSMVSTSAKLAAKNARTPEERVLHLCTNNIRETLKERNRDKDSENFRQPNTLRVMQYNVYDGIKNERRKKWMGEYIKNNVIDVLTLNELNDWSKEHMKRVSNLWGFQYSKICRFKNY